MYTMKIVACAAWYLVADSSQKQTLSDSRLLNKIEKIKREKVIEF